MKKCFKCQNTKELSEFYQHLHMIGGRVNKCKECNKTDVRENRLTKVSYYREYDRLRGNRITKEKSQEWGNKYPAKKLAQTLIHNAIRANLLDKQDCEQCGSKIYIHAHHDDYLKPFNIRWLCAAHHSQWHKLNGEGMNGSIQLEELQIKSITQFQTK